MHMHVTTAILDMYAPLDEQRRKRPAETLKTDAGVVSAGSPSHLPRVLMVAYNAARTSSVRIIEQVSGIPSDMVASPPRRRPEIQPRELAAVLANLAHAAAVTF
jgi:hypothetical protein